MRRIDADELYKKAMDIIQDKASYKAFAIINAISIAPTIEAEPVRHRKWKHVAGMNSKCSECGRYFPVKEFDSRPFDINFCPNCGAKMDEM